MDYQQMIGQKFNHLTCIEFMGFKPRSNGRNGAVYKFICDCGQTCEKFANAVKTGNTKTCGDYKHRRKTKYIENLIGTKLGRLTVVEFVGFQEKVRNDITRTLELWKCDCSCGGTNTLTRNSIISKQILSCGCLLKEKRGSNPRTLAKGEAAFNSYYTQYKERARKKNIDFKLDVDQFTVLIYDNCVYCGTPPFRQHPKTKKTNGSITVNGVDRVNAKSGYTIDNCVSCCEICNKAKRDLSLKDFIEWIKRIQNYDTQKLESL